MLLDAPCTATGTIRRHPDVAWLRQEGDIAALSALQKRLLLKATHLLKPGGTLAIIEFDRIEGVSSPRILEHVRQDQATLIKEAESQGFKLIEEKRFMKQNYALRFAKQ